MSLPLITIGITCYNEGDWLLECWQSVLGQTDDRWEAVLVMDGTTHERTREIFEQLDHPKLRKFAMPTNVGPYPARNKAFELTKTPYHFYLDADDQLMPDSVKIVLATFEKNPDAACVYGDYEYFGNVNNLERHPLTYTAEHYVNGPHPHGACAYRKSLWEQLGGFSEKLARGPADYDFHIGAMEAGAKNLHCGAVFYRRRSGHSSVTGSYELDGHRMHEIMVERHPKFFNERRRRNRFLALGYKRAAYANQIAGNSQKASALSRLALKHGLRTDHKLWVMAIRGWLKPSRPATQIYSA